MGSISVKNILAFAFVKPTDERERERERERETHTHTHLRYVGVDGETKGGPPSFFRWDEGRRRCGKGKGGWR